MMKQRQRLERLLKLNSGFGTLTMISGFWKNDFPSGFGCAYPIENEYDCKLFADMFQAYVKHFVDADAKDRAETLREYREQLENHTEWVNDNPGFELPLLGNIWFLESMGLIKPDNYNGIMFTQEKIQKKTA